MKLGLSVLLLLVVCMAADSRAEASPDRAVVLVMDDDARKVFSGPFLRSGFELVKNGDPSPAILDTSAAVGIGQTKKASVVVHVTSRSSEQGRIQSTPLQGYKSTLQLRVWNVSTSEIVYEAKIQAAGYGKNKEDALAMSLQRVQEQGKSALDTLIAKNWPKTSNGSASSLSLSVRGAASWREVSSILQQLARTPGIVSLHTLDIGQGRIRFQLRSQQSISSVVTSLRRTRIVGGSLAVQGQGNTILLTLQMTSVGAGTDTNG